MSKRKKPTDMCTENSSNVGGGRLPAGLRCDASDLSRDADNDNAPGTNYNPSATAAEWPKGTSGGARVPLRYPYAAMRSRTQPRAAVRSRAQQVRKSWGSMINAEEKLGKGPPGGESSQEGLGRSGKARKSLGKAWEKLGKGSQDALRLRCSCATAAPQLHYGGTRSFVSALKLHYGCVAAALQLRCSCSTAALRLRCGCAVAHTAKGPEWIGFSHSAAALRLRYGGSAAPMSPFH
eukprot:gene17021-biopygen362